MGGVILKLGRDESQCTPLPLCTPLRLLLQMEWHIDFCILYLLYVSNSCSVSPQNYFASVVVGVAVGVVVLNGNAILILNSPQFLSIREKCFEPIKAFSKFRVYATCTYLYIIHVFVCMLYVYPCVYPCVHVCICVCVCIHICVCACVCIHVCMCMCVYP